MSVRRSSRSASVPANGSTQRADGGVGGERQRPGQAAAGEVLQQRHQRDQGEPVAAEDDELEPGTGTGSLGCG